MIKEKQMKRLAGILMAVLLLAWAYNVKAEVTYEKVDSDTIKIVDSEAGTTYKTRAEVLEEIDEIKRESQPLINRRNSKWKMFNDLIAPKTEAIAEKEELIEQMNELQITSL
jgi:hypothetical protein